MPAGSTAYLFTGPGVKIVGDIIGCEILRVEGTVEGTTDARQLVVCCGGSFRGTAEIENAEIEGQFDGTLNVHGKLILRSSGRISGNLSYTEIEVERGGKIVGQIALCQMQKPPTSAAASLQLVSNDGRGLTTSSSLGTSGLAPHATPNDAVPSAKSGLATAAPQPAPRTMKVPLATPQQPTGASQPNSPSPSAALQSTRPSSPKASLPTALSSPQQAGPSPPDEPQDVSALQPKTRKGLFFGRG